MFNPRGRTSRVRCARLAPARPWVSCAAVALLLAGLVPFDFVISTAELHRSLAAARWTVLPAPASDDAPPSLHDPMVSAVGLAGAFAAYALLATLAYREEGRSRRGALRAVTEDAAVLALLVETTQMFLVSAQFSIADATLNLAAASLGAYAAAVARHHHPA